MDRRRRDHERIDSVLAFRVGAEDENLSALGRVPMLDRLLAPLNRSGTRRFLREARQKVWHNTLELHRARVIGPQEYAVRLAELELSAPPRSPTSSSPVRSCCAWPSPALASACRHRTSSSAAYLLLERGKPLG